jgi:hypothetical protein
MIFTLICILITDQRKFDFQNIFAATAGKAEGKEISLRDPIPLS